MERWRERGYLVVERAVSAQRCEELKADLERLLEARCQRRQALRARIGRRLESSRGALCARVLGRYDDMWAPWAALERAWAPVAERAGLTSTKGLLGAHRQSSVARRAVLGGQAIELAAELLGGASLWFSSHFWTHSPAYPLHVDDFRVDGVEASQVLACWVALDDIHDSSGGLVVVPGSHRSPDSTSPHEVLTPPMGSLVLWHGLLRHGSAPVLDGGQRPRAALSCHMMRAADAPWPRSAVRAHGPHRWLDRALHSEISSLSGAWHRRQGTRGHLV